MKLAAALFVAVLLGLALLSQQQHKPFLTPAIDAGSGVMPAANRVESTDNIACMRLIAPYGVTTEGSKKIVRT